MPVRKKVESTRRLIVPMREHTTEDGRVLIVGVICHMVITHKKAVQVSLICGLCALKHVANTLGEITHTVGRLHRNTNTHKNPKTDV